ncbi:MAG: hypothetical protein QM237_01700 [Bacteroidota bacterium]|jgi:hypothetical protein|nr:hypothetical protein [Bacteroidota bacterium]HHU95764.1 hypothetical protein [Petrimonas sp.]
MRKVLIFTVFMIFSSVYLFSQNDGKSPAEGKNRYSYYSLNLGVATDFDHVGLGLNLLELNLATQRGLGGTLKWGANSYLVDEMTLGIGYLLVGPSYSHLINKLNVKATYRALVGYATPSVMYEGETITGDGVVAFNIGATLRFAAHKRFNFVLAPDVLLIDGEPSLNVNAGIAFSW